VVSHTFQSIHDNQNTQYHRARLLAAAAAHSEYGFHALPISACGLCLNDESLRVAVGLRLGSELCHPFLCVCGSVVDSLGAHALSCKRNPGRSQRHHLINDLVWRALHKAGFPSVKEPHGLIRTDGKRPDGLTLIPWCEGRCATLGVTVTDTVAISYLGISSIAAEAAVAVAKRKEAKYIEIVRSPHFFPIAIETFGPFNEVGSFLLWVIAFRSSLMILVRRFSSFNAS